MTDAQGTVRRAQFAQVDITLLEECIDTQRKGALFVYLWLWHYAGHADTAFPSVARLAIECRMNPRDVRDALQWLTAEGWIKAEPRPGATTIYHVRTERPERKRRTPTQKRPTPKRTPLPQTGQGYPSPKRGSTPLPQTGEGTPPPNGTPNKKDLTRSNEQEKSNTPLPPSAVTATAKRNQPFKPSPTDVPPELQAVAVELLDFWAEKRGARTTRAWSGLLSELTRIAQDMHGGVETVRTQLNAAVQSGWQSVTYANWQRYAKPAAKPFGNSTGSRYASRADRQTEAVEDVVAFLDAYEPAHAAPPLTLF